MKFDFLKIHKQSSELHILKVVSSSLQRLIGYEIEVELVNLYV